MLTTNIYIYTHTQCLNTVNIVMYSTVVHRCMCVMYNYSQHKNVNSANDVGNKLLYLT